MALSGLIMGYFSIVITVVALIYGSAIHKLSANIDVAKEQRVTSDIQAISMQLRNYEMFNHCKPTTEQGLQVLVAMPTSHPKPQHWKKLMESVPLDPWGNAYVYCNPGKFKADGYDLYSLGQRGVEGDGNIGK